MSLNMKPDIKRLDKFIEKEIQKWILMQQKRQHELKGSGKRAGSVNKRYPIITVSRMRGSQGRHIAEQLSKRFKYRFLDYEVIDEISRVTKFRRQIIEQLDESARHEIELIHGALLKRKYVGKTSYFKHLTDVILSLSYVGGVVVLGRCASCIVNPSEAFRIRVVAPKADRINNLKKYENLTTDRALKEINKIDRQRADFIKRYFSKSFKSLDQYDLIINTAHYGVKDAIDIAEEAMCRKFKIKK